VDLDYIIAKFPIVSEVQIRDGDMRMFVVWMGIVGCARWCWWIDGIFMLKARIQRETSYQAMNE
jgi:hypothetical protein